jgi:hypothetical protein
VHIKPDEGNEREDKRMISREEIKARTIKLLNETNRPGMDKLIHYMTVESDFFEAPAAAEHHEAFPGGLALHSLRVREFLEKINTMTGCHLAVDTVTIAAICHDLCKTNFYVKDTKNKKINGRWETVDYWKSDPALPLGHGECSLVIAMQHIALTTTEQMMIRWHMGAWEPGWAFGYPTGFALKAAQERYPAISMICSADHMSVYCKVEGSDLW